MTQHSLPIHMLTFLMIRRPPRSTHCISSAASDVYKRQVKSCWLNHVQISGLRLSPARSTYVYGVNIMSSSQKINKLFKWIKINFNKQGSFSYLWCSLGICFPLIEKQMPVVLILHQHFWYYILSWSAYKKSSVLCSICTCVCPVYLAAMHICLYSRMCRFASSCLKRYSEN